MQTMSPARTFRAC